MTDEAHPKTNEALAERDTELGIDWSAVWQGLRKPAALRGIAVLGIGIVALAAPRLSAWLLSLLIGIGTPTRGWCGRLHRSAKAGRSRWHELGRSLALFVGGLSACGFAASWGRRRRNSHRGRHRRARRCGPVRDVATAPRRRRRRLAGHARSSTGTARHS